MTICSRRSNGIGSVAVMIPSALASSNCSNAVSISRAFLALSVTVSRPSFLAPASASMRSTSTLGLVGFISTATRDTFGAISRSSSTLAAEYILVEEDAGHVPAGAVQTLDQPKADRVTTNGEDHRHGAARTLGGACRSDISRGGNDIHAHGNKFSRKRRQRIIIAVGPPLLNSKISALNETGLGQPLSKRVSIETISIGRGAVQEAYERHPLLLRARRKGPCSGATEKRDE